MVRSTVIGRARRRTFAPLALVGAVSLMVSAALHGQSAATGSAALDTLLQRAGATAPGTYAMNGTALEPVATPLAVLLQADVTRGPERRIRVPVAVGAELKQAADVRLRVVSVAAAGQASRTLGDATGSGGVGPLRFVHEFALPPGDYEIQAVIGESKGAAATLAKSRVTVPDIWGGSLAVTPIFLGDEPGTSRSRPFNFGATALIPASGPGFSQSGSVRAAFRIFNWSAGTGEKPDLTVEYLFYERGTKGLHFFNKMKPQRLTAATLGSTFDPANGSVSTGMLVPLEAFTFGRFQLKVTVTDNRNKQSAGQATEFTVSP